MQEWDKYGMGHGTYIRWQPLETLRTRKGTHVLFRDKIIGFVTAVKLKKNCLKQIEQITKIIHACAPISD